MSDQKTLMTEVLPVPKSVIPSVSPRERVAQHWHRLVTTGAATAALAGCGCLVMDPLPPPAQCRTTRSVLRDVNFTATRLAPDSVSLRVMLVDFVNVDLAILTIDGGTVASLPSGQLTLPATLEITPTTAGAPITVTFTTTCEGTAATSVKVVLTPVGVDGGTDAGPTGWTVSATDA
ncbi:MAG: hypothetical protein Q8L48_11900 [Archangium sp.]|nr:hypothetical protein [Archangium sp.]